MEALLRLPENVAAAAAAASKTKEDTSNGSNAAPVVPLSLLRRNQRFQIGFLESLQVLCWSISHLSISTILNVVHPKEPLYLCVFVVYGDDCACFSSSGKRH